MKLYLYYLKMHFKSMLQYKTSFIFSCLAQFIGFLSEFFVIVALFEKFSNIKGYTVYEVLLTFSIIQFGFAFVDTFFRGIDKFDNLIIKGEFDRLLLRPRNLLLQVFGYEIAYEKLLKLIEAVIVFIIAVVNIDVTFDIYKVITLINMLISSVVIFFGIELLNASYCFFTIEGLEIRNVILYGGREMAQYPISIFRKSFIKLFTFIIPFGFVNYYPLLYILGIKSNKLLIISPLITIVYLIPCFLLFYYGTKRYKSTGS